MKALALHTQPLGKNTDRIGLESRRELILHPVLNEELQTTKAFMWIFM